MVVSLTAKCCLDMQFVRSFVEIALALVSNFCQTFEMYHCQN